MSAAQDACVTNTQRYSKELSDTDPIAIIQFRHECEESEQASSPDHWSLRGVVYGLVQDSPVYCEIGSARYASGWLYVKL